MPAVQLFVERARSAQADFALDDDNRAAVAEICIRLDGVPLALELAAARMRSMSPAELAERLPERFRVLAGSRRATDPRHRTLRDLVQWSYDLLTPVEQLLFDRLSVFAGLLRARTGRAGVRGRRHRRARRRRPARRAGRQVDAGGAGRPRSASWRRCASSGASSSPRRPDADAVRAAHTAVHAELAARRGARLRRPRRGRSGWRSSTPASTTCARPTAPPSTPATSTSALRIVIGVREYAWRRIRYEHLAWADVTVAMPGAREHPLYPVAARAWWRTGGSCTASSTARSRSGSTRWRRPSASASLTAGLAERALGQRALLPAARGRGDGAGWTGCSTPRKATGAPGIVAHAYYMRSVAQTSIGDPEGGAEFAALSAAAAIESGSPTALAQADYARGDARSRRTDPDACARAVRPQRASTREAVGNRWIRAFALTESLWIRAQHGDAREALRGYRDVIDTWFRGSDWANLWLSLRYVFAILESLGRDEVGGDALRRARGGRGHAGAAAGAVERRRVRPRGRTARRRGSTRRRSPTRSSRAGSMRDEELVRAVLRGDRRHVSPSRTSGREVDGERGGPGEVGRAVPVAGERGEVLGEAVLVDQGEGAAAQVVGEVVLRRGGARPSIDAQLVFTQVGPFQ